MRAVAEAGKVVAVVAPVQDWCYSAWAISLSQMMAYTLSVQPPGLAKLSQGFYGTSILPDARQILTLSAIEKGATHLLWIDSDMEFPANMIERFVARDEPIIGINASSRRKPYRGTAQARPGEHLQTTLDSTGLEKVHRTGFGVMWVAAEVFQSLELPWFAFEYKPDLGCSMGEDYYFCEKARRAGYEIYVDQDLSKEVNHVGAFAYNPVLQSIEGESP